MADKRVTVEIDGRSMSLSNLDKILYPEAGFTKAEVIDYYVRVAPTMLTHVAGRGITLKRFPDGVEHDGFFEKRCPKHRPVWVAVALGPGDRGGSIDYCCLNEIAALAWAGNMAALEIHAPMARGADIEAPTMVVFDLDPGAPAAMTECCAVGLRIRALLADLGLEVFAKTSGSKGLQLYVPLNTPHTHEHCSGFALAVAQLLARETPATVTTTMRKADRPGRIFIDWSQNARHKTTIAPYSLRARPRPTVSTPVSWDEVAAGAAGEPLSFEASDVLTRVDSLGDLFASTASLQQHLPSPGNDG